MTVNMSQQISGAAKRISKANLLAKGKENNRPFKDGEVALIGAGPGDPELLTLKAYRLIQESNCVVYDRLVSEEIMDMVPQIAEKIYVGKQCNEHTLSQSEINDLLVKKAQEGKRIVRLKGGDPYIFGRGGEEVQDLLAANIPCRVVPGITAASACTSYSGIPLTHRDHVHGCTFITGHLQEDQTLSLPWEALARQDHTLVIYMGIKTCAMISQNLIENGLPKDLPVALIKNGTTDKHQSFVTDLVSLPDYVKANNIKPPTLIVIGNVVTALEDSQKEIDFQSELSKAAVPIIDESKSNIAKKQAV